MKLAKYKRYLRIARSNEFWTRMRLYAMKNPTAGLRYWQVAPGDGAWQGIARAPKVAPSSEK